MPSITREAEPAWEITSVAPGSREMVVSECPRCRSRLMIHQPDAASPHRLLATCTGCEAWFYVDVAPDGSAALLVHIPEASGCWASVPQALNDLTGSCAAGH